MFPHIDHKCPAFCFQLRLPPPPHYPTHPKQPSPREEEEEKLSPELFNTYTSADQARSASPHSSPQVIWVPNTQLPNTDDSSFESISSHGSSDPDFPGWFPIGGTQQEPQEPVVPQPSPIRFAPGASPEHVTGGQPSPLSVASEEDASQELFSSEGDEQTGR